MGLNRLGLQCDPASFADRILNRVRRDDSRDIGGELIPTRQLFYPWNSTMRSLQLGATCSPSHGISAQSTGVFSEEPG